MKQVALILCGGQSAEHEVSMSSARNVCKAIDRAKFTPVLVGITKGGMWRFLDAEAHARSEARMDQTVDDTGDEVAILPRPSKPVLFNISKNSVITELDVCFPVLHGPLAEDGAMQGHLKICHLPFVGPSVLGSAVGMDKEVMKRLLKEAEIPVPKFLVLKANEKLSYEEAKEDLGTPLFVKPANMGSSVGVSKAVDEKSFNESIKLAFQYDSKILIEEAIVGREVECSVLGNENPKASLPGEVVPTHEFYSYEAKYLDPNGAAVIIPAKLSHAVTEEVRTLAVRTFTSLNCEGLSRVDCFVTKDNKVLVNEINTLPGFTNISMYPKMWEATGIGYSELITSLLELAQERYHREMKFSVNR